MQNDSYLNLNNGDKMPVIGLGTWKSSPAEVGSAVEYALLECGYKHIDCAAIYGNEKEIGLAFKNVFSDKKNSRQEVFITSKLWNNAHAKDDVAIACKNTLRDLQLEYLDLYLMHWGVATSLDLGREPVDKTGKLITAKLPIRETWEAMEELVKLGLVRSIGVANFTAPMLVDLFTYAKIMPSVNQVELHPYNQQSRLVEFCQDHKMVVTAYSPLGSPGNNPGDQPVLLDDRVIKEIAQSHQKSPAQILIRWARQRETIAIPKTVTAERIKENIAVFDFELSSAEMDSVSALERGYRYVDPWDWWRIPYFD